MNMELQRGKVVGVILAWNCAELLNGIWLRLPKEHFDEILLADDGSSDHTVDVAKELGIKSFTHAHSGYGGNLKFGLAKALELGADYMVEIHGDGQYDPSFIPRAVEIMREGTDLLIGSRFTDLRQPLRDKMPLARYLANIGLSFFDRLILQVPLTEFHTGFRVYSRKLVQTIDFTGTSNDYLFSFEIIAQARYCNLRISELAIRCDYAGEHKSISIVKSAVYAFQTFRTLFYYILAQMGFRTKLFCCNTGQDTDKSTKGSYETSLR